MDNGDKAKKLTISVTLDEEERLKFEVIKKKMPLRRNSDVIRMIIHNEYTRLKTTDREKYEAELRAEGVLPEKVGEDG